MARSWRRIGNRNQFVLPVDTKQQLSNSFSCWYCDWKFHALNDTIFSIGSRYSRFLQFWFTMGVACTVAAVIGVSAILMWEFLRNLFPHNRIYGSRNLSVTWLLGNDLLDSFSSLSTWISTASIMFLSQVICVAVHEFGHAIAAASEGIQMEYIAIFLATIIPGALVSFNNDLLQSLPRLSTLRIYCAGIWHNMMFCAVCWIALFLLPSILYPLYIHSEMPMVVEMPQNSPLSGHLSVGDIITSVDGSQIHSSSDWKNIMHNNAIGGSKGYCIPKPWLHKTDDEVNNKLSCPDELARFVTMPYFNSSLSNIDESYKYCLSPNSVVKLKKCGNGWTMNGTNSNSLSTCLEEEEACMMPVQTPGMSWVEISYLSDSLDCLRQKENSTSDMDISYEKSTACERTFVYVGNALSLAHSVHLSSYVPRFKYFSANIPTLLENILSCMLQVSAALVLLNSIPVYFLDGESILETVLCYFTWLTPRQRAIVLKFSLVIGSILTINAFVIIVYSIFVWSVRY